MKCDNAQDLYSEYYEGQLTPAMKLALEQHLASCQECQADYDRFKHAFEILSEGLPEVDVPAGFRASVMAQLAPEPAHEALSRPVARPGNSMVATVAEAWRAFAHGLIQTPGRAFATGVACTLIAVLVYAGLRAKGPVTHGSITGSIQASMLPVPVLHTSGILQNSEPEVENGQTYHVFGIHLPLNSPPAQISAYVLQNGSGLTDDSALKNTDNATPAWTGTGEQGVSIHVPVAVVSNVAPGTTLNFLVDWSTDGGKTEDKEAAFVPISAQAAEPSPVNAGDSLYDVLQNISSSYNAKIFVDPTAVNAASYAEITGDSGLGALTGTEGTPRAALQTALSPAGYNITELSDSSKTVSFLVTH